MPKSEKRFSPFIKQCFVTCAVCCNIIGQGCATGFPAVLLPQLKTGPIHTSKETDSWIASVMALSILLGNAAAPALMGRLGRKPAAYAVIGCGISGWLVLAAAPNVATLIVGRVIQGISYGIIMPLRPVLIGEYTSPRYRGSFLTTISLSQTTGIGLVHLIGSLLRWEYSALICCLFPLASLIMTLYSPESPSWLAVKDRFEECRDAFHWLRGEEENEELEKMIQARIIAKQNEVAENVSKFEELKLIARKKEVYKPVALAMHVYLLAQFCGSITLPSEYVYGKLNGILAYDATWIPVLLLNLQMASIGFGMVPMANVITGEVFPLQYRSILGTVSVITVAATMFMILKTFPGLLSSTGLHGTYAIYSVILAYGVVVTWFLLPETKGRTLQQIEEHFRGKPLVPVEELREIEPLRAGQKTVEEDKL
ncbi:facilitated trehalose transporter Tret1-like [Choristoneura fumiferana]|uniref:facilitated trehalose transporter Tret1-like n=1 Tax=Choristoneura fumiferana TaxID=7141 RepID=UPI003D15C745